MGQQPNISPDFAAKPRTTFEPPPARRWRPDIKPGIPTSPEEVPEGGRFGRYTPDGGYALRLVNSIELPDDDPDLRSVLAALTMARAGIWGRAPIMEDVEVALALCGYGYDAPAEVVERRERWIRATSHDQRPGQTAVAEAGRDLISLKPEEVRDALASGSHR